MTLSRAGRALPRLGGAQQKERERGVTTPDPGVYISTAQMYQEVRDLAQTVGRIESNVDSLLDGAKDIRGDLQDHELRIRTLERVRWPMPTIGVLAGVAGATTGAIALFARRTTRPHAPRRHE